MQEKKSLSAAVFQMWMLKSTISVLVAESQMTSSADCPRQPLLPLQECPSNTLVLYYAPHKRLSVLKFTSPSCEAGPMFRALARSPLTISGSLTINRTLVHLNIKANSYRLSLNSVLGTLQAQPKSEPFSYGTPGLRTHRTFSGVVSTRLFAYTDVGHDGAPLVEHRRELTAKAFSF